MASSAITHAYESVPDASVEALNAALCKRRPAEGPAAILYNTCGLVARRAVFETMSKPWFQPDYGLTGGEDDDFFLRASAEKMAFAFSPRAVVTEFVPTSRATRQFLNQRAFAQGASWTHIRSKRRPAGWSYSAECAKIVGGFAIGIAGYLVMFWSRKHRLTAEYRILRAAGKISGLMGNLVETYRVTHGK